MDGFEDDNPFETDVDRFGTTIAGIDVNPSSPQQETFSIPSSPVNKYAAATAQGNTQSSPHDSRPHWLHDDVEIEIVDAQKTQVGATSPYIVYVIRAGTAESRHRYSEFESLRLNLAKLYPTVIIPPIPSKQTIGDYAVKQGKAKEDVAMIARRKRMLQTFLNRCMRHPILSNSPVLHRFLEGSVSWTEILNSPPLSQLPKNILKAPPHDPTDPEAPLAYVYLPNPSATHPLRRPDQRFEDSETFTNKFSAHLSGPMDKVTRRAMRRWADYAQDHAELGAVLNGFSLNESGTVAAAIEKTGQATDATYMSTVKLLEDLERNWQEPLSEYSQFAGIIKKLLVYRHQKHVQLEMTQDALEAKREQLEDLEKHEREAARLEEALGRSTRRLPGSAPAEQEQAEGEGGQPPPDSADHPSSRSMPALPPHPGPNPVRRRTPGMGLINALSYTLHGMIDADPEAARRSSISKTKETISQLEDALHLATRDLKYVSSTIQADLDRFQRTKVADIKEMCIAMAKSHRDWCQKNLEAWERAKKDIDAIPDHPNRVPDTGDNAGSSGARRDSTATVNGQ